MATYEDADLPLGPDDAYRTGVPSDDEFGPPDLDENDDTTPPGGEALDCADVTLLEATDAAAETPTEPPALPEKLEKLKVPELKEQLVWRGQPTAGLKAELLGRLQAAVAADAKIIGADAAAVREWYASAAAAKPAAAPKERWEPIDPSRIDRPVYMGSERFTLNPALNLTMDTHPFDFMEAFYPKKMRDEQVCSARATHCSLACFCYGAPVHEPTQPPQPHTRHSPPASSPPPRRC